MFMVYGLGSPPFSFILPLLPLSLVCVSTRIRAAAAKLSRPFGALQFRFLLLLVVVSVSTDALSSLRQMSRGLRLPSRVRRRPPKRSNFARR